MSPAEQIPRFARDDAGKSILDFAFRNGLQMLPVGALAVRLRAFLQFLLINKSVDKRDLFRRGNGNSLPALDHFHELRRLQQALHRSRVQPGESPAQQLHVQQPVVQIHIVQGRNLQFSPGAGLHLVCPVGNARRIEVKPRHRVVALRLLRLFLNAQHVSGFVELHDAKPFRIRHIVTEHRRRPFSSAFFTAAFSIVRNPLP